MKSVQSRNRPQKKESSRDKIYGVYIDSLLTKRVILTISEIGKNIKENIKKKLAHYMEGKCIEEGFIRPGSINILSYSSGVIDREYIVFEVVFSCKVCLPVEGMLIECTSKIITKAGIHAEVIDNDVIPITVFVARDHHVMDKNFQKMKENMKILVKVIGIRYELNDPYICAIGKLVSRDIVAPMKQPINIGGDLEQHHEMFDTRATSLLNIQTKGGDSDDEEEDDENDDEED